jgi:hypothetical protein
MSGFKFPGLQSDGRKQWQGLNRILDETGKSGPLAELHPRGWRV